MKYSPLRSLNLSDSFEEFLQNQQDLSQEQKEEMREFFGKPIVRETVLISLSLILWSIVYSFIDMALLGSGLVHSLVGGFQILHYLPWFLMTMSNFVVKSLLFSWFTKEGTYTKTQHLLAAVPTIGVFLFLGDVFRTHPLFYKTLRAYLVHARKQGIRFLVKLAQTSVTLKW